jgi:hypothetical protein
LLIQQGLLHRIERLQEFFLPGSRLPARKAHRQEGKTVTAHAIGRPHFAFGVYVFNSSKIAFVKLGRAFQIFDCLQHIEMIFLERLRHDQRCGEHVSAVDLNNVFSGLHDNFLSIALMFVHGCSPAFSVEPKANKQASPGV